MTAHMWPPRFTLLPGWKTKRDAQPVQRINCLGPHESVLYQFLRTSEPAEFFKSIIGGNLKGFRGPPRRKSFAAYGPLKGDGVGFTGSGSEHGIWMRTFMAQVGPYVFVAHENSLEGGAGCAQVERSFQPPEGWRLAK